MSSLPPARDDVARYDSFLEADHAASVAHDFIHGLNGVTQQQASDAIWTIHRALRPLIVLDGDDVAGNLEGDRYCTCGRNLHGYHGPRCRYCDGTAE